MPYDLILFGLSIFLSLWAILILLYRIKEERLKKVGLEIYPFIIIWRIRSKSKWFPRIAYSKSFKIFSDFSIGIAIISAIIGLIYLVYIIYDQIRSFLSSSISSNALIPVIPGVTISLDQVPYFLIAVSIGVILHELMHAIASTSENVEVKSGGAILIGIFPGAFVEPDEGGFRKVNLRSKLRIISVGISINLMIAGIAFGLLNLFPSLNPSLYVKEVVSQIDGFQSLASSLGVKSGDVILSINGIQIHSINDLQRAYSLLQPGDIIFLEVIRGGNYITLTGVVPQYFSSIREMGVQLSYTPSLTLWMFIVNLSLGIFNAVPLFITDGGRIFSEIGSRIKSFSFGLQTICLVLFLMAISLSIWRLYF